MNKKQINTLAISLIATLPFLYPISARSNSSSRTEILCMDVNGQLSTVAKVTLSDGRSKTTPPLINWKTTEFGSQWTPQERCREVSSKLNSLTIQNGGKLSGIRWVTGVVGRANVVCSVLPGQQATCQKASATSTSHINHLMNLPNNMSPDRALTLLVDRISSPFSTGTALDNNTPQYIVDFGNDAQTQVDKTIREINSSPTPSNPEKDPFIDIEL